MELIGLKALTDILNSLNNNSLCTKNNEGKETVFTFKMNKPTTKDSIDELERKLKFKLPHSYKEFLLRYNGGRIYNYENLDGFILLGTENITNINSEIDDDYGEDWISGILIFCELIGEGNYLGFDIRNNGCRVLDCFHEELPKSWPIIAEDFDKWLELLILNEGSKFWLY